MKFGKKLLASQRREWSPYYLDYNSLKRILEEPSPPPQKDQQQDQQGVEGRGGGRLGGLALYNDDADKPSHRRDDSSLSQLSRHSLFSRLSSEAASRCQHPESERFLRELDKQLEKVVLFYFQEQGRVASDLAEARREQHLAASGSALVAAADDANDHQQDRDDIVAGDGRGGDWHLDLDLEDERKIDVLRKKLNGIGYEILELLKFVDLNVTGIRKILKKHDKLMHWPASKHYLSGGSSGRRRSHQKMKPLLQTETTTISLCAMLETAFSELREREEQLLAATADGSKLIGARSADNLADIQERERERQQQQQQQQHIDRKSSSKLRRSRSVSDAALFLRQTEIIQRSNQRRRNYSMLSQLVHHYHHHQGDGAYFPPSSSSFCRIPHHPDEIVISRILAVQRRLKRSSEFSEMLAAAALLPPSALPATPESFGYSEDNAAATDDDDDALLLMQHRPSALSNWLNFISTFLYMTNYYIIAPTAGSYSKKLGSSAAFASMLVGMTPIAALASTILYSWWTSYSYKSALIFASTCSVAGNAFYLLGLPCNSMTFVLIGRLLNGFGSARSINRRYIADSFSHSERTAASATFVAIGSLGMAAGPGVASFLHVAAENSTSPWWQQENSPGWFMAVLWSVFLVFLVFFFEDPPRRKLPSPKASRPVAGTVEDPKLKAYGTGERKPLLEDGQPSTSFREDPPVWKNYPVLVTFLVYFLLKLMLECLLSSTAILTDFYFDWSGSFVGVYMALLGLLMLPSNMVVANLSRSYDDRVLIMALQFGILIGCALILRYTSYYPMPQYVLGSVFIFLSASMLEGPNMSLLSKVIPKSWSEGFFNVGLLATEAGTLGRAAGDSFLTLCGSGGMEYMLNNTFSSLFAISLFSILFSWRFYGLLQAVERDD